MRLTISGKNERRNIFIVNHICELLDKKVPMVSGESYKKFISFVKDRPGHDLRYAIDASKIESELGWAAAENFETGIVKTVEWYIEQFN